MLSLFSVAALHSNFCQEHHPSILCFSRSHEDSVVRLLLLFCNLKKAFGLLYLQISSLLLMRVTALLRGQIGCIFLGDVQG